jgi:hypothetical protein
MTEKEKSDLTASSVRITKETVYQFYRVGQPNFIETGMKDYYKIEFFSVATNGALQALP